MVHLLQSPTPSSTWLSVCEGRLLAVADENASIFLIDARTGKITHQIDCSKCSRAPVCCLGWSLSVTDPYGTKQLVEQLRDRVNLDELLDRGTSQIDAELPTDLPAELASLDVDGILPKLSVLQPSGKEYVDTAV